MKRTQAGKSRKTARELMEELQRDPEHRARVESRAREREARVAKNRRDAAPVITDLSRVGFIVDSIADLRHQKVEYQAAVSILLEWLPKVSNADVKESIVRALSVPFAKPAAAAILVREFLRAEPTQSSLKWAIGNALEVVADDSVFDDIVKIVQNPSHGTTRQMAVVALGNMRNERAVDVLLDLLGNDEVVGHAVMALGKLKASRARPAVENLTKHAKPWVRKEAKKALAEMNK